MDPDGNVVGGIPRIGYLIGLRGWLDLCDGFLGRDRAAKREDR
jgi:hypothetical protein